MKQYTNESQTAKLIELGFEKPRSIVEHDGCCGYDYAYSIGELIEKLPPHIGRWELDIFRNLHFECWTVCIDPEKHTTAAIELVDALYGMILKLREEGVI